jgi:M6 family metalloprotease-like protein
MAIDASPSTFSEVQPDGSVVELKMNGDMYDNWISDQDGYTVIRDSSTGGYVYAEEDGKGGVQLSAEPVIRVQHHLSPDGTDMPLRSMMNLNNKMKYNNKSKNTMKTSAKKKKGLRPDKRDCSNLLCEENDDFGGERIDSSTFEEATRRRLRGNGNHSHIRGAGRELQQVIPLSSITHGTLHNLVILIRFTDHKNRTLPSRADIDILMNHDGPHPLCPTGSVRDVVLQNSYGALTLESTVIDWIDLDNTESYYANNVTGRSNRIFGALKYALNYVDMNGMVNFSSFDTNRDGHIDSITFLHSGYAAEFGGLDAAGTSESNRIWSHKWTIQGPGGPFISKSGVRVANYQLSPALWRTSGASIGRIGVISHELGHSLGLPDLYDTNGVGSGIGQYGLMSSSWGWDGSQQYPPHLSAWSKYALGWLDAIEPKQGINRIEAVEVQTPKFPQLYKITAGFPQGEFLLIENRQRIGFDSQLPQGGLAIWHIDYTTALGGQSFRDSHKTEGHPWQVGWPQNGRHYGVALQQADGLYELDRGEGGSDRDDLYHAKAITTELIPCVEDGACQYPNTDSYQSGIIQRTYNYITNITFSGLVMNFTYRYSPPPSESPSTIPSSVPSEVPSPTPSMDPTHPPTECYRYSFVCADHSECCSGTCFKKPNRIIGRCAW